MKDPRDIESELVSLRTSLRTPEKRHANAVDTVARLIKEAERAMPQDMRGKLEKWGDEAGELATSHPIATAAIALCVGVAIGQLWRRHHDR